MPYYVINRTGRVFPDYTDTWSSKKASDGLRTDWVKVSNPVSYDSGKDKQAAIDLQAMKIQMITGVITLLINKL